ncbi:MAG: DeoR/GlpR family DNA-binding transcription regulator [Treponema sp.]|jgi:DeoR/GlpR family transcriptional regulator of sugar metabolism|nr:DeoR/GlpR family DNA-binding transcription regulator [Treponema sp.]
MRDRTVKILDLLSTNKKIRVTLLAEMLDVSHVTLRKDLDNLEKRGIINRTHGYVSLDGADDIGKRMAFNYSIKRRIAKAAAQIVEEGETVMLESGSCCALFAEELAIAQKNATIITNSAFIANYVCKQQNIKIILLGGYFQPESQVLVGPFTTKCGESFYADKFFLGADGFVPEHGFTGRDHLRAETAAELAKRAKKVYILTEAAKFHRRGAYNLIDLNRITGVFTDEKIPKEAEAALQKNNVSVQKVPTVEEKIKWQRFPGQPPFLYKERVE